MALENLFIRKKRLLGPIRLDAVIREDVQAAVTITKNPIEVGADVTDHAIITPKKYILEGVVTDTPFGLASTFSAITSSFVLPQAATRIISDVNNLFGTSTARGLTRSQNAFIALLQVMEDREPFTVQTGFKEFNNMLIESISTSKDKDTSNALFFTANLTEVQITSTLITQIDRSAATINGDAAKKQAETKKQQGGKRQQTVGNTNRRSSVLVKLGQVFGVLE